MKPWKGGMALVSKGESGGKGKKKGKRNPWF